jgi:hypothetical protein
MESHELKLWEILHRAGKPGDVSEDDLAFVERCLDLPPPQAQANACEILFRHSKSDAARRRALDTIEQMCAQAAEEDYVITLLIVMLYPPLSAFTEKPSLREFALQCARSNRWQIRTNAASVLQRIAKKGDRSAIELLRLLANDSERYVSDNAKSAIQTLGESS